MNDPRLLVRVRRSILIPTSKLLSHKETVQYGIGQILSGTAMVLTAGRFDSSLGREIITAINRIAIERQRAIIHNAPLGTLNMD